MSLAAGCPRCAASVATTGDGDAWCCPDHGVVPVLWRPEKPSYDDFVDHLALADTFPTYLPWPLGPGWQVSDFAVVRAQSAVATLTIASGTTDLDGAVDVIVVAEEAGVGLGTRCAGTIGDDPGPEVGAGAPTARLRVDSQQVSLWPVSAWKVDADLDPADHDEDGSLWQRSAVVGEADGRWLWLVFRPASAILMLRHEWILRDVSRLGPSLVELPFGECSSPW